MIKINSLPFFHQANFKNDNGGFPQSLPFDLYFDENLKMFRENASLELQSTLIDVYKKGSLLDGSISSEAGKIYIDVVIDYIFNHSRINENSKLLEIGFGSGILLTKLKDRGISHLTGIEPGGHTRVKGLEGITLIDDYFPSEKLSGEKFDLIYSYGIVEHIEDPALFLENQLLQLSKDGKIIFSVPNCEPYLKMGDFSIFIHEHFSYFTTESIYKLASKINCYVEDVTIFEGVFIVTLSKSRKNLVDNFEVFSPQKFFEDAEIYFSALKRIFEDYKNDDLAIYVPWRALNALYLANITNVRLVDDSSEIRGKYLPTLNKPIESYEEMCLNPPKAIVVFSRVFDGRIKDKCMADKRLVNTKIFTLNDLKK